jgi:N-acetylglucosamine-6-phosphate deacetylase
LPAHLEGPFLSPARRGAHREVDLVPPDPAVLRRLLDAGPVGCMTLAPELDGALALIDELVRAGVVVAIGHTEATAQQVRAAVDAGARLVTHCWNAQRPPTAREPGTVGVALGDPRLVIGLIADLVHVAPELVRATMAAGSGRVAATTDAVTVAGLPPERWPDHDGAPRWVDGAARLADGTIAGGVALPDECLRNLVGLGATLAEAVDACGGVQRRLLGRAEVRMRPGDPAEVLVLDEQLQPVRTVIGDRVFEPA